MVLVVTLYAIFTLIAMFAPLRWAIFGYVLLACVDFPGTRDSIGLLNAFRGFALPIYMLWRLRGEAGHRAILVAPIAWGLLIVYAGIACTWSDFPTAALKLVGHMAGSLLIGFVFARAAKGGFLTSGVVLPVTIGSLSIAIVQLLFLHNWTGEPTRFDAFTPAQAFASFLGALYCMALCAPGLAIVTRLLLCSALGVSLLFNGSRIWFCGVLLATLIAFLISSSRAWLKLVTAGAFISIAWALVIMRGTVVEIIQESAPSNRIIAAGLAVYQGDMNAQGLGTLRFRREVDQVGLDQISHSSFSDFMFGRGTSNGALITGSLFRGYAGMVDPNRMIHDEWVRVLYEWGLVGLFFWCVFWGSIVIYAIQGVRTDKHGFAKPLVVYVPALLVALAGENFIAGAGNAMSIGFLMLFGFATLAHRRPTRSRGSQQIGFELSRELVNAGT